MLLCEAELGQSKYERSTADDGAASNCGANNAISAFQAE
jgi:hypothetical protein